MYIFAPSLTNNVTGKRYLLKMETTADKLEKACIAKKISYDRQEGLFGIRIGKYVWHWFNHLHGDCFLFNHSYSQNTGMTNKGLRARMDIERSIEKRLGVKI